MFNKGLKIIKNRSDIGAGTRGADMGIDALEIAAINQGSKFFYTNPYLDVQTHNETIYEKTNQLLSKRLKCVLTQCQRLSDAVSKTIKEAHFPLVLSGDHSSALGTINGIKSVFPNEELGVIWIDAHADLHSAYTTPSGNVHGMPLAAALHLDNKENSVTQLDAETQKSWDDFKNIGGSIPKIKPENLMYFALRDTEAPEDKILEKHQIKNYAVHELRHRGLTQCLDEAIKKLEHVDHIYISFDVDSLDCDLISKGTGTPVSKGLDPEEVKYIIKRFCNTKKVCCLEVCEINPLLDYKGNKMAETAFSILEEVIVER